MFLVNINYYSWQTVCYQNKSNFYDYNNTMLHSRDNATARRRRRGVLHIRWGSRQRCQQS